MYNVAKLLCSGQPTYGAQNQASALVKGTAQRIKSVHMIYHFPLWLHVFIKYHASCFESDI